MNSSRKPRGDSKLKTLPEARQDEIAELLRTKSLDAVRKDLAQDGIATSVAALSEFFSWYQLKQQFRQDESTTETLLEQLKREVPDLSEDQLDELGQRTFSLLSIRNQNLQDFVKIRSARFKAEIEREKLALRQQAEERLRGSLALQREKFQRETAELFLKWSADKRAREIATSTETNASKIERLGQLMFGDDWAFGQT